MHNDYTSLLGEKMKTIILLYSCMTFLHAHKMESTNKQIDLTNENSRVSDIADESNPLVLKHLHLALFIIKKHAQEQQEKVYENNNYPKDWDE